MPSDKETAAISRRDIIMAIRETSTATERLALGEPDEENDPLTICVQCQTPIPEGREFHERGEPKHRDCLQGWMIP